MSSGPERIKLVFAFRLDGDIKFVSHHDTLRLMRRALARAQLPVRFTEGFNPHPKLSLPLPRPVGMASDAEVLVVEMSEPVEPAEALTRLAAQMPPGVILTGARAARAGERFVPIRARFQLDTGLTEHELSQRTQQLLSSTQCIIQRREHDSGRVRNVDVRLSLVYLICNGSTAEFMLRLDTDVPARPSEVAAALGFDAGAINHRIRRMEVEWNP